MDWQPIETFRDEWEGDVPDLEVRGPNGEIVPAVYDLDDGWMNVQKLDSWVALAFVPTHWRVKA